MKPAIHLLASLFFFVGIPSTKCADRLIVTVTQNLDVARPAETVVVPWAEIASRLPGVSADHLAVRDARNNLIAAQVTSLPAGAAPGHVDELVFQHDFAVGEKSATFTVEMTAAPPPPFPSKVFARYVPERFDDFAWENDRIAHRIYGPKLETPAAGRDQSVGSGIDVWCKRVREPIVNRWYARGHYHEDIGEGLDMYDVGKSRGCGGTGIWDGKVLRVSRNWESWKLLANGPVRAVFELSYEPWEAGGVQVSETKRFTVDAGHNLDAVESTFTFQGSGNELTAALGVAKHTKNVQSADPVTNEKSGWLSLWEHYAKNGQIGTAVLVGPGVHVSFAEDDLNHLLLARVRSGVPLRYYAGAGWDQSGDFPDRAAWEKYVQDFSTRLESPVKVSIASAQ